MDVLQEIFLTAFFSLVFAFVLAKLVSAASDYDKETDGWKQTVAVDDVPTTVGERIFGPAMEGVVYERVREATLVVRELPEFGTAAGEGCGLRRVVEGERVEEEKDGVVERESLEEEKDGVGERESLEEEKDGVVERESLEEEKDGVVERESLEEEKVVVEDHVSELASSSSDGIAKEKLTVEEQTKEVQSLHRSSAEMTEEGGERSEAREMCEIGAGDVCKEERTEKQLNLRSEFDSEPPKKAEDDDNKGREEESRAYGQGGGISDEEDWEGIERSEVSKLFNVAETFIASPSGSETLSKLGNDVQMQLYGLHKAATEGPCYESSPSALKPGARAKWNAWQKLGNMSPEMAMEQYIAVLSESIPQWRASVSTGNQEYDGCIVRPETVAPLPTAPDSSSSTGQGEILDAYRKVDVHACSDGGTDSCESELTEASSHVDPPGHATVDSSV
ncbi:unnamed protein product [Victoria cruziana]